MTTPAPIRVLPPLLPRLLCKPGGRISGEAWIIDDAAFRQKLTLPRLLASSGVRLGSRQTLHGSPR